MPCQACHGRNSVYYKNRTHTTMQESTSLIDGGTLKRLLQPASLVALFSTISSLK